MAHLACLRTTLVGSYPAPVSVRGRPSASDLLEATAAVLRLQEEAGIDLLTDGELFRFDPDHPESNGMIEHFVRPLENVRSELTDLDVRRFRGLPGMEFRARSPGVVTGPIGPGDLDLPRELRRSRALTDRPLKLTLTGPHMLAKTLLDSHYGSPAALADALAGIFAEQVAALDTEVVQVDEANVTGHPQETRWALSAVNRVLDGVARTPAVHLCFGNYGGRTIQRGTWDRLVPYLSGLHADHVLVELTRRGPEELAALADVDPPIRFGVGVLDVKSVEVESPEEVARRIEAAAGVLGEERIAYVNPDCGLWTLPPAVAEAKVRALVAGRDRFAGS